MKTNELSTCIYTNKLDACSDFYQKYFAAKVTFDCEWYINLSIGGDGPTIQFMEPQRGMPLFNGLGIMLNFEVEDVDAEHDRLIKAGLEQVMPLTNHPWGDRGFSVTDPIGTAVYIYSVRQPAEDYRQYYKD